MSFTTSPNYGHCLPAHFNEESYGRLPAANQILKIIPSSGTLKGLQPCRELTRHGMAPPPPQLPRAAFFPPRFTGSSSFCKAETTTGTVVVYGEVNIGGKTTSG